MIIDVFSGQMTDPIINKLKENNIKPTRIPANMTNLFQSLDLTVNDSGKAFIKKKFTEWYSFSISKQLEEGKSIEDIDVALKLSILKPLHAKGINDFYDYINSEKGHKITSNGLKATFITEEIEQGTKSLKPLDPFYDIDPLINEVNQTTVETLASQDGINFVLTQFINDEDE